MKKLLLIVISLNVFQAISQNLFPATGNVGIGTSQPSEKLDVNGNLIVDSCLIVKDSVMLRDRLVVDEAAFFRSDINVEGQSNFGDDMSLDGVLTLKPMIDATSLDKQFLMVGSDGQVLKGDFDDAIGYVYRQDCHPFQLPGGGNAQYSAPSWMSAGGVTINDPKMYTGVSCPARVGIGTSDPNSTFDVRGRMFSSVGLSIGNGTHTSGYMFHLKGSGPQSDLFLIESNSDEVFKISSDGLAQCREVKITLNAFADYVFDSDYPLMPLDQVESYIKTHKHLPNMPSEEDVIENGVGVGELQVKQQEKIEELTLYIIEQQKQIDELKQQIEALNK